MDILGVSQPACSLQCGLSAPNNTVVAREYSSTIAQSADSMARPLWTRQRSTEE